MKAVRFENYQTHPVLREIERPTPGPGQVLLKVAGSGACHTDVTLFAEMEGADAPGSIPPPRTLGHETSGWVEEIGEGVEGFTVGDAYVAYGPIGCQECVRCTAGEDTFCVNANKIHPFTGLGLTWDGGMAEYIVVPADHLVAVGDADPVDAAALADAGMTSYRAVRLALPQLEGENKHALVIGLGGLGQLAVQILHALTGATVIATDMKPEAMAQAAENGATVVPGGPDQADKIREITGGIGVDAVFDFVGVTPTIELGMSTVAAQGQVIVVGLGGGDYTWNYFTTPFDATLSNTYWGFMEDLRGVTEMYRKGQIVPETTHFTLDEAEEVYHRLEAGDISGRAVIVPHMQKD